MLNCAFKSNVKQYPQGREAWCCGSTGAPASSFKEVRLTGGSRFLVGAMNYSYDSLATCPWCPPPLDPREVGQTPAPLCNLNAS